MENKTKQLFLSEANEPEKILLFDVETTGLDPFKNAVITLSGAIILNGEPIQWFDYKCRPNRGDIIEDKALEINGYTKEEIMSWPDPKEMLEEFFEILKKHVKSKNNKFNPRNRFVPMAYNAMFDVNMLSELVKKTKTFMPIAQKKYDVLGALVNRGYTQDVHKVVTLVELLMPILNLKSHKLSTVAETLEIPIKAHLGISDCRATWAIWRWCIRRIRIIGRSLDTKGLGWYE